MKLMKLKRVGLVRRVHSAKRSGVDNIFISYRRTDSIATAGRLRDRLVREFGRERVFVDVDDIPHGEDFVKVLEGKVSECRVLLVLIGPNWVDASDEDGRRRLDNPDDFVVIEIASGLAREAIAVIPILVDGARMPTAEQLPKKLQLLARRNAIELRNSQFGTDAERLIRSLRSIFGADRAIPWRPAIAGLVLFAVLAGGYLVWPEVSRLMPDHSKPQTAGTPGPTEPQKAIAVVIKQLRACLGPSDARMQAGIKGGSRIKLGDQVVFYVTSRVAGRLILININPASEVTQIFPNSSLARGSLGQIAVGATVTVSGPGYGFSDFKAVEPAGRGQLVALVLPADRLALVDDQRLKGFEPVNAPGAYLSQLLEQARGMVGGCGKREAGLEDWAFALAEYEIVN